VERDKLTDAISSSLATVSDAANDRFAQGTDLWLADDEECDGVATPLANIVVRHMPAGMGGPGNPDLADAIAAGITLFRYAFRQVVLWGELRRARKAGAEQPDDESAAPAA
jgi:hypothetical protein